MQQLSLREVECEARRRLPPAVYDFIAGGAEDELTLRANESAFARLALLPRVLCGTGKPDLETNLLGCPAAMPVLIAPTAFHRLVHPDGECATARAAGAAGVIMTVSMASTAAIEDIAGAVGGKSNLWFQLYIQPDLGFTEAVIRRAEAAGVCALVVTVDSPTFGRRERDKRHGFHDLPPGVCCENMREVFSDGVLGRPRNIVFSPEQSWEQIDWLRKVTTRPVVLKGILHPADALLAIQHGADAVFVSNHGGRQLDTVPATIDALPAISDAVAGRIPLLLDGGIRRGSDVVKALALGANAVAVGRPVLWGLAVDGEPGVSHVLETLRSELERTLMLCGCASVRAVTRDLVRVRPTEEPCLR